MQYSLVVRYVCCVWRFVILSDPALPHRHRRDSGPCHHGAGGYAMIQILGSAGLETNCERCLGGRHFFSGFDTPATCYHHYPEGAESLKCHGLRRLQMPGQDGNQVVDGVLYISPGKG